jgi:hypothetical protein
MISHTLIAALIWVESQGDNSAVNRDAVGCLQIRPCVIVDVNSAYGAHYTLDDRLDREKSKKICALYLTMYCGATASDQQLAECWRYGPTGSQRFPDPGYWERVQARMKFSHEKHTSNTRRGPIGRFLNCCARGILFVADGPDTHAIPERDPYPQSDVDA